MDHQHGVPSTADSQHNAPGGGGGQHDFVDSILDSFGGGQQSHELLEMLHVPLLHGGVKEVLLFASFATTSTASFTLACFLLALSAGILEGLRLVLWWVESRYTRDCQAATHKLACECKHCTSLTLSVAGNGERKNYDAIHDSRASSESSSAPLTPALPHLSHLARHLWWVSVGFLHFIIYVIATLLMLIAMTMNIYLIVSMGAGAAIGKMITICVRSRHVNK